MLADAIVVELNEQIKSVLRFYSSFCFFSKGKRIQNNLSVTTLTTLLLFSLAMITVTLGTIAYPFDRAIAWLKILLDRGVINESVFIQHGTTDVSLLANHPLVTAKPTVESAVLIAIVQQSRLILSHAGQGSTCMLASQGASFVLLPRLSLHEEHIDDHQLLFAQNVKHCGVQYCLSLEEVEQVVLQPPPPFQGQLFKGPKLPEYLKQLYSEKSLFSQENIS